jgi:hypothetical protein
MNEQLLGAAVYALQEAQQRRVWLTFRGLADDVRANPGKFVGKGSDTALRRCLDELLASGLVEVKKGRTRFFRLVRAPVRVLTQSANGSLSRSGAREES